MADQVQGPTNILSEIMEHTGIFKNDGSEVTSIFLLDTDSSNDLYKGPEDKLIARIESIADHVVPFGN